MVCPYHYWWPVVSESNQNAAWVTIATPLTPAQLFDFATDVERLFRLNPYLQIHNWDAGPTGMTEDSRIRINYFNEVNGVARDLVMTVAGLKHGIGYTLNYSEGVKRATEICVEPSSDGGTTLLIKDYYHVSEENLPGSEQEARLAEVDRSLTPWGVAIRQHLLNLQRWGWLPFYRVLRERFWLGMPPRSRRISRLLIWITVLEFMAFLFVFLIYLIEFRR